MPNSLTQNPIEIETTLASYKAGIAAILGTFHTLRVSAVYWLAPNLVGDVVVIVDPTNGLDLVRLRAEVALQTQYVTFEPARLWRDFSVVQISSGRIYLYTV